MGSPRHEYWSGLLFSPPGDLPDPGIEPGSPALQKDSLPTEPPGKPQKAPTRNLASEPLDSPCRLRGSRPGYRERLGLSLIIPDVKTPFTPQNIRVSAYVPVSCWVMPFFQQHLSHSYQGKAPLGQWIHLLTKMCTMCRIETFF